MSKKKLLSKQIILNIFFWKKEFYIYNFFFLVMMIIECMLYLRKQNLISNLVEQENEDSIFSYGLKIRGDGIISRDDIITKSMDMNLSKLGEIVEDRGTWHAAVLGVAELGTT